MSKNERVALVGSFNPFTCARWAFAEQSDECEYAGDVDIASQAIETFNLSKNNPLILGIYDNSQHQLIPMDLGPTFAELCLPNNLKGVVVPKLTSIDALIKGCNTDIIVKDINSCADSDLGNNFFSAVMNSSNSNGIPPPAIHFIVAKNFCDPISPKAVYDILCTPSAGLSQLSDYITQPAANVLFKAREVALETTRSTDFTLTRPDISISFNSALRMALR